MSALALLLLVAAPEADTPPRLQTNRRYEVLPAPKTDADRRRALAEAARRLGGWSLDFAGTPLDGAVLRDLAEGHADDPLLRTVREVLRRPVDLDDFLLFLDDLARESDGPLAGRRIALPPGRGRAAGILLHPNDVFRPKRAPEYGEGEGVLLLAPPTSQEGLRPAEDGEVVGPPWAARYRQPEDEPGRLAALAELNPSFAKRVRALIEQLRAQGAWCEVEATVRKRERGYLIYGSYWLGKANGEVQAAKRVKTLERLRKAWKLDVPVTWTHPEGWAATVAAANDLAETYGVAYATRRGAKRSNHYDGDAADIWAVDLPRRLTLEAPDGEERTFDLSAPEEPRDLSLTPRLIRWIERHFAFRKLRSDYPHWTDAR